MKQLQQITFATVVALGLSACGGVGSDPNEETPTEIAHHGTTYGFVTSPFTGKVWLDRNLGAARVCEQLDDEACFGDYYQWGRGFDGHQDPLSGTTDATTVNHKDVGHGDFIIGHGDWVIRKGSRPQRRLKWAKADGSSVCPVSFRVPTLTEFQAELSATGANAQNNVDTFNTFLKLSSSGERSFTTGLLVDQDANGRLWTNDTGGSISGVVFFDSGIVNFFSEQHRANGYPVRCIKE